MEQRPSGRRGGKQSLQPNQSCWRRRGNGCGIWRPPGAQLETLQHNRWSPNHRKSGMRWPRKSRVALWRPRVRQRLSVLYVRRCHPTNAHVEAMLSENLKKLLELTSLQGQAANSRNDRWHGVLTRSRRTIRYVCHGSRLGKPLT